MSGGIKLLFDENLGKPMVEDIAKILSHHRPAPQLKHILDFWSQGEDDSVWIPKIASEGYVIISADRARRYGGSKLPLICSQFKVTHILLTGSMLRQLQFERVRAIVTVWPGILKAATAPAGSRFILRMNNQGNAVLVPYVARPPKTRREAPSIPELEQIVSHPPQSESAPETLTIPASSPDQSEKPQ